MYKAKDHHTGSEESSNLIQESSYLLVLHKTDTKKKIENTNFASFEHL